MLALPGILLVFAAVLGGFVLERGNLWVLMQPAELARAGERAQLSGRRAARPGNRGGSAGRRDHDGSQRRRPGDDWSKGCGGVGGNVPGHSAVLWRGWAAGVTAREPQRRACAV